MKFGFILKFSIISSFAVLLFYCDKKDHIRTFRLPKTQDSKQMVNVKKEKQSNSKLIWTTPSLWKEVPGHSMRLASFHVPCRKESGDLSITTLEGESGGIDANVNRWLGQIGLTPSSGVEINSLKKIKNGKLGQFSYFKLINYENEDQAILASIYNIRDTSVFVKLMSNLSCLMESENEFIKFCESLALSE